MKINILGVQVDSLTQNQALEKAESFLNSQKQHYLITANPEIVLKTWQNPDYRQIINRADLVTADGIGLLWAAKFLALKSSNIFHSLIQMFVSGVSLIVYPNYCRDILPERICGVDLMEKICELASKKNWKVYLLGGEEGIADLAGKAIRKKYINLNIIGTEAGPQFQVTSYKLQDTSKFQITNSNFQNIVNSINNAKPDVLFVAFGAPKQEFWIAEFLHKIPSVRLAMGVGGAFDFISGKTKRAPEIYRELGLEWLFRLINEPWRAIRIFNATLRFVFSIVRFKHKT